MEGQYIPEGALGKVWRVLDRCIMFTTVVGSLASVMFIGAMFLNVIMRYVFSSPIWWFDEMIIGTAGVVFSSRHSCMLLD